MLGEIQIHIFSNILWKVDTQFFDMNNYKIIEKGYKSNDRTLPKIGEVLSN